MAPPASASSAASLPPGYHFVPEDKELVGSYLVPRILGQPLPPSEILDVDPLSAPPPVLLKRNGRKRGQDAFFFAEGQAVSSKGSRQKRTCAGGGTWQGQTTGETLRVRCCGMDVEWRKKSLNFHEEDKKGSTGWVMHEYAVTAPPKLAASLLRVYRIRFSGHGKNAQQRKRGAQEDSSDSDGEGESIPLPAKTQRCEAAVEAVFVGDEGPLAVSSSPRKGMTADREIVEGNDALFIGECPSAAQSEAFFSSSAWFNMMEDHEVVEDNAGEFPLVAQSGDHEAVEDNSALFVGECPLAAVVSSSPRKGMMADREIVERNDALFMGECPSAAQSEAFFSSSAWFNMMGDHEVVEDNAAEFPLVAPSEQDVSAWKRMMGDHEALEDNSALFVGECPLATVVSSSPWLKMMADHGVVEDNAALFVGEWPLAGQSVPVLSSSPWKRMGDLFNNANPFDATGSIAGMAESMGTPSEFDISTVLDCYTPPLEMPESLDFFQTDD